MYTRINFKSKKALKEAVSKGETVTVFQPNDMFINKPQTEGIVFLEGPHYPEPHRWYAEATLQSGKVVKVK